MKDSIVIKGNKYGLTLFINEESTMDTIKAELIEKLEQAKKIFSEGNIGISFDGKSLSTVEKQEIIELINDNSKLNVVCIVDEDASSKDNFKHAVEATLANTVINSNDDNIGCFHKGTIRSGQSLESETSIVVIGDVNPGANLIAKGNIIVLGALKGNAFAGAGGDASAFVVALKMNPMQIRIADVIARCPDNQEKNKNIEPQIAFISEDNICIENLY